MEACFFLSVFPPFGLQNSNLLRNSKFWNDTMKINLACFFSPFLIAEISLHSSWKSTFNINKNIY